MEVIHLKDWDLQQVQTTIYMDISKNIIKPSGFTYMCI